ncbi:hypothetical protein AGLY_016031 [Aphis glycines]|uniref:Uncharacterized protein n=1 Tax=Aphis glycines TaxID=307491 RepID=A0A6G0SYS5_APHGL|nr:hypothetical protein AGLY_016031 [Aphis glycines]
MLLILCSLLWSFKFVKHLIGYLVLSRVNLTERRGRWTPTLSNNPCGRGSQKKITKDLVFDITRIQTTFPIMCTKHYFDICTTLWLTVITHISYELKIKESELFTLTVSNCLIDTFTRNKRLWLLNGKTNQQTSIVQHTNNSVLINYNSNYTFKIIRQSVNQLDVRDLVSPLVLPKLHLQIRKMINRNVYDVRNKFLTKLFSQLRLTAINYEKVTTAQLCKMSDEHPPEKFIILLVNNSSTYESVLIYE